MWLLIIISNGPFFFLIILYSISGNCTDMVTLLKKKIQMISSTFVSKPFHQNIPITLKVMSVGIGYPINWNQSSYSSDLCIFKISLKFSEVCKETFHRLKWNIFSSKSNLFHWNKSIT